VQGRCRWEAAGGGRGADVGRVSTVVPGVERAPNPVAARACETWNPDGVRAFARSADRKEGPVPQREEDDPKSECRQSKGNRNPGQVAGASASRSA
jgi:hypothetical protein